MIHDATVKVTCDGKHCRDSIDIQPDYKYRNMAGNSGYYDCSDEAIVEKLEDAGWVCADDKQYCSDGCAP
jgi:hypothetical protein